MQDQQTLLVVAFVFVLVAYVVFRSLDHWVGSSEEATIDGAPGKPQDDATARVTRVIDGDTVDVTTNGCKIRVRLDAIDCPENGQHWGDSAKFGLIKLIGGKKVLLENHGLDQYGRTLATIYVSRDSGTDRINVNERMLALGHAWVMRRYYNHLPEQRRDSLNRIEAWAKSKKVGLWNSPNPIPPWRWRTSNRNGSPQN